MTRDIFRADRAVGQPHLQHAAGTARLRTWPWMAWQRNWRRRGGGHVLDAFRDHPQVEVVAQVDDRSDHRLGPPAARANTNDLSILTSATGRSERRLSEE